MVVKNEERKINENVPKILIQIAQMLTLYTPEQNVYRSDRSHKDKFKKFKRIKSVKIIL